ncbi:MAG: tetratricopeptide repeat protein [Treponema sp.]|jgi:tetratricopeptide (TPR) repeat protein|nr:tetratricopeptide repeat protein [Treponema sp.]
MKRFLSVLTISSVLFVSCITPAVKAEEYYALGMAYFKLQRYAEAETWFTKAKFNRTTKIASEYYLGRIAYETGRFREAKNCFERIIVQDADNITALKAAAYTCIKLEDYNLAENYYRRVLELVPESYDEGYNYALVLMAMGKAEEAEGVLIRHSNTENPMALLILARSQRQRGRPEAADAYNASLLKEDDPLVRSEYAAYLAEMGLYEKALEEYRRTLKNEKLSEEKRKTVQEAMGRLETDGKGGTEAQH